VFILGLETSCDETSAAVVEDDRRILSSVVASQADLHAKWGGVVPEVASRMHVERTLPVIIEALEQARCTPEDLAGIAVTNRPGLVGALVVGVACAKALAYAWRKPLIGVHHLVGHVHAAPLADRWLSFPFLCLVVSGGHTELIVAEGPDSFYCVGRTRDDAAGECFDKAARLLGLPYPGGPALERLAREGNREAVSFPRAWLQHSLDFSFSGLKTAVARYVARPDPSVTQADIAASLQAAIVDVLVTKTILAAEATGIRKVAIAGGVAANETLASEFRAACKAKGYDATVPPKELCTDNAAMIAAAAYRRLRRGEADDLNLDVVATEYLPLRSVK